MSSNEDAEIEREEGVAEDVDDEDAGKYDRNESFAEEALAKQTLTKDIVADCISLPYRLGYGFSHAFVKLDCSDRRLSDISLLRGYIHLRFVILSNNFITDICPVSVIGHLIYLKADNNQIEEADCLNSLRFLQFLDLSGNKLTTISDLCLPLLQHLKVNDNLIRSINTSEHEIQPSTFPSLHTLELRNNRLVNLAGIDGMPTLKSLYLAENNLTKTDGISGLTSLVRLHLRDNQIRELTGFTEKLSSLQYINLRGNKITQFRTVQALTVLPALTVLSLVDNPVCNKDDYRLVVVGLLPGLQRLDKDRVTESERFEGTTLAKDRVNMEEEAVAESMEEHHNAEVRLEEEEAEAARMTNEEEEQNRESLEEGEDEGEDVEDDEDE